MVGKALSPREEQIVALAEEGHTNECVARELGLSLSTVNTYWVRIRMKVHGDSRTAVVARLIRDNAERELRESNSEREALAKEISLRQDSLREHYAALSLLQFAMDQLRSAVWSTDLDLRMSVLANGEIPGFDKNLHWETGNTIYDVFNTTDPEHPAVAAHISALAGAPAQTKIACNCDPLLLVVRPLKVEDGSIIGCIGVMSSLSGDA